MGSSIRVIGDYHIFWPDAVGVMAAPTTPVPSLDGSRLVFLKAQGYAQVLRMALAVCPAAAPRGALLFSGAGLFSDISCG